jgi:hypothetical protein
VTIVAHAYRIAGQRRGAVARSDPLPGGQQHATLRATDEIEESVEHAFGLLLHRVDMAFGLRADRAAIVRQSGAGEFLAVVRMVEPALDQRGIHFQMELETVGAGAGTEGLVRAVAAAGEVLGTRRQIEAIAMPLEHGGFVIESAEDGVVATGGTQLQRVPADFRLRQATDRRAEHVRQQLRAEADAQYRLVLRQCPLDRLQFGAQVWPAVVVFDVHRTTEDDQSAVTVDVGLCVRVAVEVDEADTMSAPTDQAVEGAERLGGDVLEDEQAGHGTGRKREPWHYTCNGPGVQGGVGHAHMPGGNDARRTPKVAAMTTSTTKRTPPGPWKPAAVVQESVSHVVLLALTWLSGLGYLGLLLIIAIEVPLITLLTIGLYPQRGLRRQLWDLVKVSFMMSFLMAFVLIMSGLVAIPEFRQEASIDSLGLDAGTALWVVCIAALHLAALRWQAHRNPDPRRQWARLALVQGAINLFTVFGLIFVGTVAALVIVPLLMALDPPWRPDAPLVLVAVGLRYSIALLMSRMTEAELAEIATDPYID